MLKAPVSGRLAWYGYECPTDCTDWPDEILITVTGTTLDGGSFNDTYTLTKSGSSCIWTGTGDTNGYDATYQCLNGFWIIDIDNGSGSSLRGKTPNVGQLTSGPHRITYPPSQTGGGGGGGGGPQIVVGPGGGGGVCPDCSSGCETNYYSTIPNLTGTCGGDCANISDATVTQVGSTCQWTGSQSSWTHELVCETGVWYYRVWSGGVGGTLCAEWKQTASSTPACPPLGGTGDGVWERTGNGACSGTDFSLAEACPGDCTSCDDDNSVIVTISGMAGLCANEDSCNNVNLNKVHTMTRSGSSACSWTVQSSLFLLILECVSETWHLSIQTGEGGCGRFEAPNTTGCPPAGSGWVWQGDDPCSGACCTAGTMSLSYD